MAVQLLAEGGVANTPFKTYIVDLLMELPYLEAPLGAQATCLEDGRKYVMGSDGTWKKINNGVDLYDEQVTESKIAYKAVSADKIANEAVTQRTLNADTVLPEEDQGTDVSTVTTGEKYQWNHSSSGGGKYLHYITLNLNNGDYSGTYLLFTIIDETSADIDNSNLTNRLNAITYSTPLCGTVCVNGTYYVATRRSYGSYPKTIINYWVGSTGQDMVLLSNLLDNATISVTCTTIAL